MYPVPYFTWVGWLFAALGLGIVSGAAALGRTLGLSAIVVSTVVVSTWALLSGFMHWDGLADTADGIGVRGDAERRLAVMRDSSIGAFGVTAIVLVALVQVAALAVIVESGSWWALAAPVVGRFAAALALWHVPPARADGLGARYANSGSVLAHGVLLLPILPLALVPVPLDVARVAATLACIAVAAVLPQPFVRRIGGMTGDVLGATVVLTETVVLVVGALTGGLV